MIPSISWIHYVYVRFHVLSNRLRARTDLCSCPIVCTAFILHGSKITRNTLTIYPSMFSPVWQTAMINYSLEVHQSLLCVLTLNSHHWIAQAKTVLQRKCIDMNRNLELEGVSDVEKDMIQPDSMLERHFISSFFCNSNW